MRFVILVTISILALSSSCFAETNNLVYSKLKVKNRAAIGFTNSGTAMYNYQEIDEYSDELTDEEKGNIELKGELENVREVYNYIDVKKGISDAEDNVTLGTVRANSGKRVKVIDNTVTVHGGVSGKLKKVSIGGVQIRNTRVRRINSHVSIKGDINAK